MFVSPILLLGECRFLGCHPPSEFSQMKFPMMFADVQRNDWKAFYNQPAN